MSHKANVFVPVLCLEAMPNEWYQRTSLHHHQYSNNLEHQVTGKMFNYEQRFNVITQCTGLACQKYQSSNRQV